MQNLSILFYLKRKKTTKDGKTPIYVRITIDGLNDEFSFNCKVSPDDWDSDHKRVRPSDPDHAAVNKKLSQAKTDLERLFDLDQAKNGLALPERVKASYLSPLCGQQVREDKAAYLALSDEIDAVIKEYIMYNEKLEKARRFPHSASPGRLLLLEQEKDGLKKKIAQVVKKANPIFDKKESQKTFILTIDEYFLSFIQLVSGGHRSIGSLEKWMCRKRRFIEFLQFRYKKDDIPLAQMEYSFMEELSKFLIVHYQLNTNSVGKYTQSVKEMMERALSKGWMPNNVFAIYKCRFIRPDHSWLTMEEMEQLIEKDFGTEPLNQTRDIFVFSSFTGYGYQEVYSLKRSEIVTGSDGKKWVSKKRQKTRNDESVPLLPLPSQILDKYKDHPVCIRTGRLLPVTTNQDFNCKLKEIGDAMGFEDIVLRAHKARFFFANEVTYDNGVPLKTISKLLGHASIKTTEIYVSANKRNISENMGMVQDKLFNEKGELRIGRLAGGPVKERAQEPSYEPAVNRGARVIQLNRR